MGRRQRSGPAGQEHWFRGPAWQKGGDQVRGTRASSQPSCPWGRRQAGSGQPVLLGLLRPGQEWGPRQKSWSSAHMPPIPPHPLQGAFSLTAAASDSSRVGLPQVTGTTVPRWQGARGLRILPPRQPCPKNAEAEFPFQDSPEHWAEATPWGNSS